VLSVRGPVDGKLPAGARHAPLDEGEGLPELVDSPSEDEGPVMNMDRADHRPTTLPFALPIGHTHEDIDRLYSNHFRRAAMLIAARRPRGPIAQEVKLVIQSDNAASQFKLKYKVRP
jgi:hypothetical protein